MQHVDLEGYFRAMQASPPKGPLAIIMAEDPVEVDTTLRHHIQAGFRDVLLLAPEAIAVAPELQDGLHRVTYDVHAENALVAAVNRVIEAFPGLWMYYCFNAEYLFHPFCETRTVRDLIAFHAEERRDAMLTYVVDLYAGDLDRFPNAVSLETAHLDRSAVQCGQP